MEIKMFNEQLLIPELFQHILSYVDIRTIKTIRLVAKRWDSLAIPILMQRCSYDLQSFSDSPNNNCDSDRLILFSSSKFYYSFLDDKQQSLIKQFGHVVKCIRIFLPLNRNTCGWLTDLLTVWCPNIIELHLDIWGHNARNGDRNEEELFFNDSPEYAIINPYLLPKDHTFASFGDLPSILTIRIDGIRNNPTSNFVLNLLHSCSQLKHLYLGDLEEEGFQIISHLANPRSKHITSKLLTFQWKMDVGNQLGENPVDDDDGGHLTSVLSAIDCDFPPHQMFRQGRLKNLHWDIINFETLKDDNFVFPKILEAAAFSLKVLGLRGSLSPSDRYFKFQFPQMHQLTILRISIQSCYTIPLSELVDAVPNLMRLELTALEDSYETIDSLTDEVIPANDFWHSSLISSADFKPHKRLRTLTTEMCIRDEILLNQTIAKFPNLQELFIGFKELESELELNQLFDSLCHLKSLRRLKFVYSKQLCLSSLCQHLLSAGKCESLLNYELDNAFAHSDDYQHVELEAFREVKDDYMEELLVLKSRSCKMQVNCAGLICDSNEDESKKKKKKELCQYLGHEGRDCPILLAHFLNYVKHTELPIIFQFY
jgi:hypothetical protein